MKSKFFEIFLTDFDQFKVRDDIKNPGWFKFPISFLSKSNFFSLKSDQKMIQIGLICIAVNSKSDRFSIHSKLFSIQNNITQAKLAKTLTILKSFGLIDFREISPDEKPGSHDFFAGETNPDLGRDKPGSSTDRGFTLDIKEKKRIDLNKEKPSPLENDPPTPSGESEKKREAKKRDKPTPSESDLATAERWLAFASREMPWQTGGKNWTLEAFADSICEIRVKLKMTDTAMAKVLDWVSGDEFWRKNAISPRGLMAKSKNGNRKIDNILVQMRTKTDRTAEAIAEWAADDSPIDPMPF